MSRLSLTPIGQSSEVLSSQVSDLEAEKLGLAETLARKEAELAGLGEELQRVQKSLASERESGVKVAENLQNQLNEKVASLPNRSTTKRTEQSKQ